MQAQLLMVGVGLSPINGSSSSYTALSFSSAFHSTHLAASPSTSTRPQPSLPRWLPLVFSSSPSAAHLDHYAVLGLPRNASFAHVKRAYRLLARKVLSNEATRTHYDRDLKLQEDTDRRDRGKWNHRPECEDRARIYRWAEVRLKMRHERYWERHSSNITEENPSYDDSDEMSEEGIVDQEKGPFTDVLRSAFISIFILRTFGSRWSLTFSSLMAMFDRKLDAGYKIGYVIAWILGGSGGVLLTLCLSFASWVCGKTSSSIVALVVVAMWVASSLARYAPLPQGALLTLLYMSIKLQVELN
ncbi:uncharacterized protein LOC121267871 isoform X2 [Juglans microcarpa x Juglans regia]|uniref:uncharacterized protein LOC121267871 isoform X2 n=1 Tax=Juglans microcarpa x Juglans regia TaxID=2249226 RepID=UPI001B7DFC6F|nr:uncharacterized protein LOC121267871 isoform X2 [Juglans microcarpa x Juglans regia]